MDNRNNSNNNNPRPGGTRFNFWIYGVIAFGLLALQVAMMYLKKPDPIQMNRLEQMVAVGDIERIEVVNKQYAYIYLTEEALDKPENKDATTSKYGNARYHFYREIGPEETFYTRIQRAQDDAGIPKDEQVYPDATTKQSWLAPLLQWVLPLAIVIAIWIFIMRRVSGGAGGPGAQIFNIGKSKATLFDNNAKVNVTFEDVV